MTFVPNLLSIGLKYRFICVVSLRMPPTNTSRPYCVSAHQAPVQSIVNILMQSIYVYYCNHKLVMIVDLSRIAPVQRSLPKRNTIAWYGSSPSLTRSPLIILGVLCGYSF